MAAFEAGAYALMDQTLAEANTDGLNPNDFIPPLQLQASMSIAISLKRIADAITYQDEGRNLFDIIEDIATRLDR